MCWAFHWHFCDILAEGKNILMHAVIMLVMRKHLLVILLICAVILILFGSLFYIVHLRQENERELAFIRAESLAAWEKCVSDNKALNARVLALEESISQKNAQYEMLQQDYASIISQKEQLGDSYSELREDTYATLDKIEFFESEIEDSLSWFRENSAIENITNANRIKNSIKGRCHYQGKDGCIIKAGCFYLVNYEYLGIRYMLDKVTSGETDKLQSLAEVIRNYGGDCEDYSLFFKAEYNHAYENCDVEPVIEAWMPSGGSQYFLDLQETWYLDDAVAVVLPKGHVHPSVVCYLQLPGQGHCIIAFTNKPLESVQDIVLLDGASLIEPQDGRYMGLVNQDIMLSSIFTVITDKDLYQRTDEYGWVGYAKMKEELAENKALLIGSLS